jgi:hypothetical protein
MKSLFFIVLTLTFISCSKKGCIDKNAENYSSHAKTNDGSCSYRYIDKSVVTMQYDSYDTTSNYEPELYIKLFKMSEKYKQYVSRIENSSFSSVLTFKDPFYLTNEDWTIQIWDNDPEDTDDLIVSADFNPFVIQPTNGQSYLKLNITKDNKLSMVTIYYNVK